MRQNSSIKVTMTRICPHCSPSLVPPRDDDVAMLCPVARWRWWWSSTSWWWRYRRYRQTVNNCFSAAVFLPCLIASLSETKCDVDAARKFFLRFTKLQLPRLHFLCASIATMCSAGRMCALRIRNCVSVFECLRICVCIRVSEYPYPRLCLCKFYVQRAAYICA